MPCLEPRRLQLLVRMHSVGTVFGRLLITDSAWYDTTIYYCTTTRPEALAMQLCKAVTSGMLVECKGRS